MCDTLLPEGVSRLFEVSFDPQGAVACCLLLPSTDPSQTCSGSPCAELERRIVDTMPDVVVRDLPPCPHGLVLQLPGDWTPAEAPESGSTTLLDLLGRMLNGDRRYTRAYGDDANSPRLCLGRLMLQPVAREGECSVAAGEVSHSPIECNPSHLASSSVRQ